MARALLVLPGEVDFRSPSAGAHFVWVDGGSGTYTVSVLDTTVATVAQTGSSPNLWGGADTLSGATLTGLTLASTDGPNGSAAAEYTGTGAAIGSNAILDRVVPVIMGQTYVPSFWIDPSQIANNNGSTPNVLNEFAGSTANGDGSYSNVDGKSSATAYALASASPFAVAVNIQRGALAGHVRVIIGNKTNGYSLLVEGTDGKAFVQKYVGGSLQSVSSGNFANGLGLDGAFHAYGMTVTPGSPNTITVFCDSTVYTITDSSLTLTSGTWPISLDTGGSTGKVKNYTINPQIALGINTADNLTQILQQYVALNTTTTGRYATSAWTCPTNLVPHSDDFSGWDMTYAGTGTIVSQAFSVPGTGAALNDYAISPFISVTQGESVTLSGSINASQCSSSQPMWAIYDVTGKTQGTGNLGSRLFTLSQALGSSGRVSNGSYTIPAGVTQIAVVPFTNGCVVPSGQTVTFSHAMLVTTGETYYISSQNPQVQVFAQLLSSAIVASGQKFKISQPMLLPSNQGPPFGLDFISDAAKQYTVTPVSTNKAGGVTSLSVTG